MTSVMLKARAYDILAEIERLQGLLRQTNQQIPAAVQAEAKAKEKKPEDPPKEEKK